MRLSIALAGAATLFFLTAPRRAEAAEGVKRVGVHGGFAGVAGEGSFAGYGGGLSFGYSITDSLMLAALATASSNQVTDKGGRSFVLSQAVGITYSLDVIQYVPWLGLFAGVYELGGGGLPSTQLKGGGQLAAGFDWVYSRTMTFGIELRAHALPGDFLRSPDNPTPFYATTFLKAEYTWGWF